MKHSGVGRVGAGLSTEFVVSGCMPCILRLVGLLRAGEALVFVVCVYFLCILRTVGLAPVLGRRLW